MNQQEIFDKVVTHLRKQGQPAKNEDGECQYRTEDGLMCAVGCLIPDNLYREQFEGYLIEDLFANNIAIQSFLGVENENLLAELQIIHDDIAPKKWEDHFQIVASNYQLEYKEP
jgi:hypothetical protein